MAKTICYKIDGELFRDIHVRAAQKGVSTQQYMNTLIERDLFPEQFPQLTAEQIRQLRDAMEAIDRTIEDVSDILWDCPEQNMGPPGMTLGG